MTSRRSISYRAKLGVDSKLIAHANHVSRFAVVEPGRSLHIDNEHIAACDITNGILVNLPQRMLFYYKEGNLDRSVSGRDRKTRLGDARRIIFDDHQKQESRLGGAERYPRGNGRRGQGGPDARRPGPGNPLGNYWMGTSIPGIGIHATNVPASIYSYHTHGCVRLDPENAKDLFGRNLERRAGMIVYEPVMFAKLDDGRVFLEVDRDIYTNGRGAIDDVQAPRR